MSIDPAAATTTALLVAFLTAFLGLIRGHLSKIELLDKRRVEADERQADVTSNLVTEIRRLVDRMDLIEDRFHSVTPVEHRLSYQPPHASSVSGEVQGKPAGPAGPGSPGQYGPKRSVTSG